MPITALPPNAVRAIGSEQALSDSASVVKELLDNAIDGRATRVFIEMSANTLDDIRVKDNGYGIAPGDRAMICTRYCTSKIRDLHDLDNVGGRYLGFRGEALASAAEMSGSLTVTSRIEGEATAVELKFDRNGQILNETRTSHPVGTSVRVEKFLQHLPVRRQVAERMGVKMQAKVKRMLQAYALARPHLHLSLKILKAKDRKGDWTYPKSGALAASQSKTVFGAATDMFGAKLMGQCDLTIASWSSTGDQIHGTSSEKLGSSKEEGYTLEAVLAKRDCEGSVLSNVGQYLSVDSRPVSCTRGPLKQIISSYKSHLRSAAANEDSARIVDPFLCLNITCPPGSYDANVEPAKDDVLFINSELLLDIVEQWFNKIYGEVQLTPSKPPTKDRSILKPHGIELLLARHKAPAGSTTVRIPGVAESFRPQPRPAPKVAADNDPHLITSITSNLRSSIAESSRSNNTKMSAEIGNSTTDPIVTPRPRVIASPDLSSSRAYSVPSSTDGNGVESSNDAVLENATRWKGSMYADDEDDEADLEAHLQRRPRSLIEFEQEEDEHLRDVNVSNPWTFAKLNATVRPLGRNKQLHTPCRQIGDAIHSNDPLSDDLPTQVDASFPKNHLTRVRPDRSSPEGAYPTPSPFPFPQKARGKPMGTDVNANILMTPVPSNKGGSKGGALDAWVQKSQGDYMENDHSPDSLHGNEGPPDLPYRRDFISARSLPSGGIPLSEIPDASRQRRRKPVPRRQQQGNIDKPFTPPVRDPNHVWFNVGENPPSKRPQKPRPNNKDHHDSATAPTLILRDDEIEDDERVTAAFAEQPISPMHPDLAITLDYESRKQRATESHRKTLREQAAAAAKFASEDATTSPHQNHLQLTTSSPHKNRQTKAIAALHTSDATSTSSTTALPPFQAERQKNEFAALNPSDPRAYLLRLHQQQASEQIPPTTTSTNATKKSRRQKTALLPLETVTQQSYTGNLTLKLPSSTTTNLHTLEQDIHKCGAWDQYIQSGKQTVAFAHAQGERSQEEEEKEVKRKRLETRVKELVRKTYAVQETSGEGEGERARANIHVDFSKMPQIRAAEK